MSDPHYYVVRNSSYPAEKVRFGDVIWTNHALDRLEQRKLPQELALKAFRSPDKTIPGKQSGSTEYQKYEGKSLITIIAKKNDEDDWVILSCWVDPPLFGTSDYQKKLQHKTRIKNYWKEYNQAKRAGPWGKIWYQLKMLFKAGGV